MRRSISLSPIRTESGANLRTANWTRLKFRNPNQQQNRNYNNYGNYHNNNRGYHNQRYQNNRGRGYYRNQNYTTTRYIPKRRYSSNRREDSRSRSRSYSRSPSRDRSRSRSRYSRSRSRSMSHHKRSTSRGRELSRSYSPEPKNNSERPTASNKSAVKTEAASYYSAQSTKNEMDFPEKVASDLNRWGGSPSGYSATFQSSANKKMQEQLGKNADAEEVQEKMKKTALESIARHEKSLHKIKLEQRKLDSGSGQSDEDYEVQSQKKKKKGKKKKVKVTKVIKKRPKVQKVVRVSDSDLSNSESSDEKSSDAESSSSSAPPPKKSKAVSKRKKSIKDEGSKVKAPLQPQPAFYPYPQGAVAPGAAPQPMMMMAPNMSSGDMKFINPYGQPMNMIKFEMPGPDGKMMQFMQIPSMPQGAMQPVMMAQPVTALPQPVPQPVPKPKSQPQPVAAPATIETSQPNLKVVPLQEDPTELPQAEQALRDKDLSEKQKRRKEVIRTRLWPRPASSRSPNEGEDKQQEQGGGNQGSESQNWPMQNADDTEKNTEKGNDHIPGLSPPMHSQTKSDTSEVQGQKIPTVGGTAKYASAEPAEAEDKDEEVEEEEIVIFETYEEEPASSAPTATIAPAINPPGLVAYPQIVQGFTPVFSNQSVAQPGNQPNLAESHDNKRQDHRWSAATEEFIRRGEKSQPSSDGEVSSSSSDEAEKYVKVRRESEGKRTLKGKAGAMKEKEEEARKSKKKKKNKKERKMSIASEEPASPTKDKRRKKKKKNKDKDVSEVSEPEGKVGKRSMAKIQFEQSDGKKKKKDGLRDIPQELPLSHIRGLVHRKEGEGGRSIFAHVDFVKVKKPVKSLREAHDTYEDQFVSLFHEETAEATESPLTMSRSTLKKVKIRPQGTRSVTHMTKITLCERIAISGLKDQFSADKGASQKVSVNLASLSSVEKKFEKPRSPSRSPSRSSRSPSKSLSRSSKSPSKSRSPRRYRSKSPSRSSYSSRSRSRSRSLPKAYTVEDDRARDEDRRIYRRDGNRYHNPHYNQQQQHQQQFRYNPQHRYQNRGRGNYNNNYYNNNRGNRGNYYNNNRGNYNNRGYFNRNRGYYNNNNNRQQWRPNYNRDRRDSDRGDRSFERRSYTRSPERRRASSYSSDGSDRRERSVERHDYNKHDTKDARSMIDHKHVEGKPRKSPMQWAHDKYEETEEMKSE